MAQVPQQPVCARCGKAPPLCVCTGIEPEVTRTQMLILQHPQEQDVDLGTARLATLHVKNAVFKIGLSWPNLAKALGRSADPKRWAVLYMGSSRPAAGQGDIAAVDKKGNPLADQNRALDGIDGIILLDGTWSQAKALWWRNPWMLKCKRLALNPVRPSRYGKLRKEPRREGLATIEAAAAVLGRIESRPDLEQAMTATFDRLLAAYRAARTQGADTGTSSAKMAAPDT